MVSPTSAHRAEETEVPPLRGARLQRSKRIVRVLSVQRFHVGRADWLRYRRRVRLRTALEEADRLERLAGDAMNACGDIVPRDFVRGNVIGARLTRGAALC